MSDKVNWDFGLDPPEVKECECDCHKPTEKPGDIRWIDGHCFMCEVGEEDEDGDPLD